MEKGYKIIVKPFYLKNVISLLLKNGHVVIFEMGDVIRFSAKI